MMMDNDINDSYTDDITVAIYRTISQQKEQ